MFSYLHDVLPQLDVQDDIVLRFLYIKILNYPINKGNNNGKKVKVYY